jgi:SAM-dependent methyltransferase
VSRVAESLLAARGDVPVFAALIAQGAGAMAAFGLSFAAEYAVGEAPPLLLVLSGQGIAAAIIGMRIGLARWWIPINIALPPAAGFALTLPVPGWIYLASFILLALVYWNAGRGRVPLYLSSRQAKTELAKLMPPGRVRFLDLGSGFGGTVFALAAGREGEFVGIESAPLPFALSWLRATFAGLPHARVVHGDFRKHDLAGYDLVYAFLSPAPMAELFRKARAEMKPGSLFVSNTFEVPGETPERTVELDDWRGGRLFIWRM